jgi:hypothetical protein
MTNRERKLEPKSWIVAAVLVSAVAVLSAGCESSTEADTSPPAAEDASTHDASLSATAEASAADASATDDSATDASAADTSAEGNSQVRSPPSQGGTSGTVDSVSTPSFILTTGAGQQVTVNETSSTTYDNGTSPSAASAITPGANVLVLGIVDSTTITATQVTLLPGGLNEAAASADAGVLPFQQGTSSPSKQVGQIPANYTEGEGTIVDGTTADDATESALATFPGVIVDRVVQLTGSDSATEYEAHCISVNWPHHIFVDQEFNFQGAY